MKHNLQKYLTDVLQAIDLIRVHLTGIDDFETFAANVTVKDAVIRRLTIIGEALYQTGKIDKELAIPEKEKIIGLRHILVHDYGIIEDKLIWSIVSTHLAKLYSDVEAVLVGSLSNNKESQTGIS